jgi:hypothetical protein
MEKFKSPGFPLVGCAAGKFLIFEPTIPTKNKNNNLEQNSRAKNINNKTNCKIEF